MDNLVLGSKYYRYLEDDSLEIVRIYKYNGNEVKVYMDNNKENKFKLSVKELEDKYVKLSPHGVLVFCIATLKDNLNDVIISLHRIGDLTSNNPIPACVCRQNITDIFANQLKLSNKMYVGCSMSTNTCPPDIDYRIMFACNGISKSTNISVYMDDTLDDILNLVNTKEYDNTLRALFIDHVNYETKNNSALSVIKDRIMKLDYYNGYCKSLRLLLEQNNFMYDFYQAFNIIPLDVEVTINEDDTVDDKTKSILEDIYQIHISSTFTLKYWYDIDLDEINNTYSLVIDKNNNLFVIAYVSSGSKHIEIENVESDENIIKLLNSTLGENKSIKEAAEYIRINKGKYKV